MKHYIGISIGVFAALSVAFQGYQIYKFVNAGKRFTAEDGRELCERVAELERRTGIKELPCDSGGE